MNRFKSHLLAIAAFAAIAAADISHGANAQVNSVPGLGNRDAAGVTYANQDGQKASYFVALGGNTPAATPTDIAIITGSSTKIIRVTRVRLTVQATAAGLIQYDLVKRVGGTQSAVNTAFVANTHGGLFDSGDAASAVITAGLAGVYTANPASLGTLSGILDSATVTMPANGTTVIEWKFCDRPARCPVLRGTTQILAINGAGHTLLAGEKFGVSFEYTEE
jgi:hypothetical protein